MTKTKILYHVVIKDNVDNSFEFENVLRSKTDKEVEVEAANVLLGYYNSLKNCNDNIDLHDLTAIIEKKIILEDVQ